MEQDFNLLKVFVIDPAFGSILKKIRNFRCRADSNQTEALTSVVLLRIARQHGFESAIVITEFMNMIRFVG